MQNVVSMIYLKRVSDLQSQSYQDNAQQRKKTLCDRALERSKRRRAGSI